MELEKQKRTLDIVYNMFIAESDQAKEDLHKCINEAQQLYNGVVGKWNSEEFEDFRLNYDNALSDLICLSDKIRKFNAIPTNIPNTITTNIPDKCSAITTNIACKSSAVTRNIPEKSSAITTKILDKCSAYPTQTTEKALKKYTYTNAILEKYNHGYEAECILTFIKDAEQKLFFITETGNNEFTARILNMQKYFGENRHAVQEKIPDEGQIFGIYSEGYIFRAVRENGNFKDEDEFHIYLLDTGEEILYKKNMEIYFLHADYQMMPAQAILCELKSVINSRDEKNLSEYLTSNLYVKHTFYVRQNRSHFLEVDLDRATNPFKIKEIQHDVTDVQEIDPMILRPITNPFNNYAFVKTGQNSNEESNQTANLQVQDLLNGVSETPMHYFDCAPNHQVPLLNKEKTTVSELTPEQLNILYEEPLCTTNAMKAVMGYDPRDDKRICQFYNAQTGSCFKGANCRFEHVAKLKDGWTRDQAPVIMDVPSKLVYPNIGEIITLIPTHVTNVEEFFAHFKSLAARYQPTTLKQLTLRMNSSECRPSYKKLETIPVTLELVIALFADGLYYRARVLRIIDDNTIKVFYVDYGNSGVVPLRHVRKWEQRFSDLPFQAVHCRLVGISEKKTCSPEATEELRRRILNKSVSAQVVDNIDQLHVRLIDSDGFEIAEQLIVMELANPKEIDGPMLKNQMLPA